ncbi:hypothetical protein F511_39687 [Dorcoceras hygrometricum]|uniref:Uncharacterized protein n=1 Tax=Dorcoceras hygrometricum TaxID=472368 RepID=A0A2Z7A745_9LAMI|nr:hypothetical protein F511_39687 [Dorcoceras hygrometricum]
MAQGGDEPRDREPEAHLYLVHVECVEARRRAMSPLIGMGKNYFEFTHGTPFSLIMAMSDSFRLWDFSSYQGTLGSSSGSGSQGSFISGGGGVISIDAAVEFSGAREDFGRLTVRLKVKVRNEVRSWSIYKNWGDDLDRPISHLSTVQIASGTPTVASIIRPPPSTQFAQILSTARKRSHVDYGFLPKTQPGLNPAIHVSLYRRLKSGDARIEISFDYGFRLGSRCQGDTSLIHATKIENCRRTYATKLGISPEDHTGDGRSPASRLHAQLGISPVDSDPTRPGERKPVPQSPDVTELLDVVVLALG